MCSGGGGFELFRWLTDLPPLGGLEAANFELCGILVVMILRVDGAAPEIEDVMSLYVSMSSSCNGVVCSPAGLHTFAPSCGTDGDPMVFAPSWGAR